MNLEIDFALLVLSSSGKKKTFSSENARSLDFRSYIHIETGTINSVIKKIESRDLSTVI